MKVTDGMIVSIPCNDTYSIGKVLYTSQYFKNVMLLKIFRTSFENKPDYNESIKTEPFELFYTGTNLIKIGIWENIAIEKVSSEEKAQNKRIVGGDVWLADECLSAATDNDLKI